MMKRHFKELLVIFVGVIFTLPCIVIFPSVYTISDTYAQEKTAVGGADQIKDLLLRPDGWILEWRGDMGEGVVDLIFETRGENVVAKLYNAAWNQGCKRNVTITSDVVKMDGCNVTNITLTFDPNDHEYPFKGGNQNLDWKFKAK